MTGLDILSLEYEFDMKIKNALFKIYDSQKAEELFQCVMRYSLVNIKDALFQEYDKDEAEKLWWYVCNYDSDYPLD